MMDAIFGKNILKTKSTTSKSFNYALGKVTLNFTLRNDIKKDMQDFLQCLKGAILEVEEEIKKIK